MSEGSRKRSTFLYFAYGSNLWTKRMHLKNPSAIRKGIAQLRGYRLDFYQPMSIKWNGSPATIIEDENRTVWGVVYEIDSEHLTSLDAQEGGKYRPLTKQVITPDGEILECRVYQKIDVPTDAINLSDPNIPYERKPSKSYMNAICRGAEESQLPEEYIDFLKSIVHNGRDAIPEILTQLFGENQ